MLYIQESTPKRHMVKFCHERLHARIGMFKRFRFIFELRQKRIREFQILIAGLARIEFGIRVHRQYRSFQIRKRRHNRLQGFGCFTASSNRFTSSTPLGIERIRQRGNLFLTHNRRIDHILENIKRLEALFATQVGYSLHAKREQQKH